jgi:hypothetical protein
MELIPYIYLYISPSFNWIINACMLQIQHADGPRNVYSNLVWKPHGNRLFEDEAETEISFHMGTKEIISMDILLFH